MATFELTESMIQALSVSPEAMKDPELKALVLDFAKGKEAEAKAKAQEAEDIKFSNQDKFILRGEAVSVARVAYATVSIKLTKAEAAENKACNTLGQALPESASENQHKVSEAWAILKRIQRGKKAQGEEFSLNYESRQALVESAF